MTRRNRGNGKANGTDATSTVEIAKALTLDWLDARAAIPPDGTDDHDETRELLDREAVSLLDAVAAIRWANGETRPGVGAAIRLADNRVFVAMPQNVELQEIEESPGLPICWGIIETTIAG